MTPDIHGNRSTVREWTRTIEAHGLRVESIRHGKHLIFQLRTPQGRRSFIVAKTPSCPFAARKKLAELRRLAALRSPQ